VEITGEMTDADRRDPEMTRHAADAGYPGGRGSDADAGYIMRSAQRAHMRPFTARARSRLRSVEHLKRRAGREELRGVNPRTPDNPQRLRGRRGDREKRRRLCEMVVPERLRRKERPPRPAWAFWA